MLEVPESREPFFKNNAIPIGKDSVRILAIGNSFTQDALTYMNDLINETDINQDKLGIYMAAIGGASLEQWYDKYNSMDNITLERMGGRLTMNDKGTLKQLLSQDWDIITLQQVSTLSVDYRTFNPYLRELIKNIRKDCTNSNLAFAWQLVWSYWDGYGKCMDSTDRYDLIVKAAVNQMKQDGVDIIIPIGTAIENARMTSLQTNHDLTRDGIHLSFGVGRYVAACTWFEALLSPIYNTCIIGNPSIHKLDEIEKTFSKYESPEVTPFNKEICQVCAYSSCVNPFVVTNELYNNN